MVERLNGSEKPRRLKPQLYNRSPPARTKESTTFAAHYFSLATPVVVRQGRSDS
jgi:hypothetical protein